MKRYPKDPLQVALDKAKEVSAKFSNEAVDLEDMLSLTKEILRRDIRNLADSSLEGKLGDREARTLVEYITTLTKLVKDERDRLEDMDSTELEALAKTKSEGD